MRFPRSVRLSPALVIFGALGSAAVLIAFAPVTRAALGTQASGVTPTPTAPPTETPVPVNAFLSLDVTAGDPNTQITVNGGAFLPNEAMTLYWDQPNKVAGSANADQNGNFSAPHIKPFAGDAPGIHKICASVPPNPCASFTLQVGASPTASPSATPSPTPSTAPSTLPSQSSNSTPIAATLNGFDVISRPPFVFLPLIGFLAILVSLGYWVLSVVRRPRTFAPSAAVVHRASRPDYSAEFGATPPALEPTPSPSAWEESVPKTPVETLEAVPPAEPAPSAAPEPAAEPEPPLVEGWGQFSESDWPELPAADEPPELPEPGE
jgi:hypothetical protein